MNVTTNSNKDHSICFKRNALRPEQIDSANYVWIVADKLNAYISENHFRYIEDESVKKKLVKNSIKRVTVEVFSFCNRHCKFCPTSSGTRPSEQKYLSEDVYLRILQDLKSIDFDNTFMFHLYNEPLADRIILERIRQAKMLIPKATLYIATNGDYLSRNYIEALYTAGINTLYVSMYDAIKDLSERNSVKNIMEKMLAKLGLSADNEVYHKNLFYKVATNYRNMSITIISRDINNIGCDRGGLVNVFNRPLRSSPCFAPFVDLDIDWQGNFLPCCNIYADNALHHAYITGNLHDGRSIFDHYVDQAIVHWRKELCHFYPKKNPCQSCSRLEFPELTIEKNLYKLSELTEKFIGTANAC